ncbi:GNAT family N-acetyltransferase [Pseudogemmobacter sonorensis]|uniref:GNAT family N-acetyltransferase n=1 Tax=Pseudogemmobacter sonorensis TaxID=2989681 RepID=UPI0036A68BF2
MTPLPPFTPARFAEVMEATWPPHSHRDLGPFRLREGVGGGKRVSAASREAPWRDADLSAAEAAMAMPLFVLREGDEDLDRALAARGYRIVDPVVACAAPVARLTGDLPPMAAFAHWPPLASALEIWAEGGIGPGRIAVMARVQGPKSAILARTADRAAGVAFVACHGAEAMVHAIEVRPSARRQGTGSTLLRAAANWAAERGAARLSLAVTERNAPALSLYHRAGLEIVGRYHYRARPDRAPVPG